MVCIHTRSRDTGFIQYFDESDYLHFVRNLDAKVIASRYSATVLNVRMMVSHPNSERRGDGPKHRSVHKGVNEEGKQTYQIQSYVIFWHFRLSLSVFNRNIPVFTW